MSATGSGSAVSSGKRPLSQGHATPSSSAASCDGAAVGAGDSGNPRPKRRLFAAGGAILPARPDCRTAAAAAEMDRMKLRRRRLIICAAGLVAVAVGHVVLMTVMRRRGRKYSAQQLAPLCDALNELASAVRATALAEPPRNLYPTVMSVPGFTKEELINALMYLAEGGRGAVFLTMSEQHRVLWIKQILAEQ